MKFYYGGNEMNRRLTKVFIGALSFAAALSTAVVFNASDAQAKKPV